MFGRDEEENMPQKNTTGNGSASILGAGSKFNGTIKARGTLRVEGEFEGEAICDERLEVGKTGVVRANLTVKDAVIAGKFNSPRYGNVGQSGGVGSGDIGRACFGGKSDGFFEDTAIHTPALLLLSCCNISSISSSST